ncbi:hypothetical protein JW964_25760 [candidate division KSB1 bacterium]|nr:hypothetical protein [candidate division KSB1 bacterium]
MKKIAETQNEPLQLQRLAAQRRLYDEARKIQTWRYIIAIPVTITWAIFANTMWESNLIPLIGNAIIAILTLWPFSTMDAGYREKAAKIQELFDCDVLNIPWNNELVEIPPAADYVADWAAKYDPKKYPGNPIENWYSGPVDDLPLPFARIVCQRSNLMWDARLRKRYIKGVITMLVVVTIPLIGVLLWIGLDTAEKYANIFASLGPIFMLGINEIRLNLATIVSLQHTSHRIDELWNFAFRGKADEAELSQASRNWQNNIYRHRKDNPVIARWLYKRFRDPDEENAYQGTTALVEEAKRLLIVRNQNK